MDRLSSILSYFFSRETFFIVGNLFSIASFILSLFVLWNVRKLRNTYKLRARGPVIIRELVKAASNLSQFLNEYQDFLPQIREELGRISVKLHSLKRKVNRPEKKRIERTVAFVDQCKVGTQSEESVREVYFELRTTIEQLKEYQKDLDWEV